MNLTQEDFDDKVLEFAKAITKATYVATMNLSNQKLILSYARQLAVAWYEDADARQEDFQKLINKLGKDAETTSEASEPKKRHYGTAGPRTF